ncbi:MAG: CBS domain-containing protein, partial [Planctomycetes bacterium]|nr:CBS domain-containing protein [Planctomycetota bacterium]
MQEAVAPLPRVVTVKCDATVKTAAAEMSANKVGCLVVNDDDGKYVGIVTERDIVNRVIASSKDLGA